MFRNALYLLIGLLIWVYDSWCRSDQPVRCCICKGGVGVVAYEVPKPFGRTEQVAFCQGCIEGLRNAGGLK